jgi:hypothetical protein
MRKITKKMVEDAADKHFRTETSSSLDRHYALIYLRAKQTGDMKMVKYMGGIRGVRANAEKIIREGNTKKKIIRRSRSVNNSMFGTLKIKPLRF